MGNLCWNIEKKTDVSYAISNAFFLLLSLGFLSTNLKYFMLKIKLLYRLKKSKGDPEITKKSFFCFIYYLKYKVGCPLHNTLNAGWLRLSFGLSVLGGPLRGYFGSNTVILFSYILFDILYVYLEQFWIVYLLLSFFRIISCWF